mmetsp:Transcript_13774/g.45310  ORF Transcript_13774/g.45310 Transcript_13774/m.45310 type:complete len:315 (-) Transcript_13774:371-1315(-)
MTVMAPSAASSIVTSVGIPSISKSESSFSLRASSGAIASTSPISPKYSLNDFSSRSDETKMSSIFVPFALSFFTVSVSCGVKRRHGGHQWALWYVAMCVTPCSRSAAMVVSPPLEVIKGPLSKTSASVGGIQGKPSGDPVTDSRPFVVIKFAPESRRTNDGMPRTLYFCESLPFNSRSLNGSANHGCSPQYSLNWSSSLSLETKMISNFLPSPVSFLYRSARTGVNPRQGGHQCAEKYNATHSLSASADAVSTSPVLPLSVAPTSSSKADIPLVLLASVCVSVFVYGVCVWCVAVCGLGTGVNTILYSAPTRPS